MRKKENLKRVYDVKGMKKERQWVREGIRGQMKERWRENGEEWEKE